MAQEREEWKYAHEAVLKAHTNWIFAVSESRKGVAEAIQRLPDVIREYQEALKHYAEVSEEYRKKNPPKP